MPQHQWPLYMESGSFDTPIGRAIGLLRLDIEHVCAHQGIDVRRIIAVRMRRCARWAARARAGFRSLERRVRTGRTYLSSWDLWSLF